jgi:hypothetical protein
MESAQTNIKCFNKREIEEIVFSPSLKFRQWLLSWLPNSLKVKFLKDTIDSLVKSNLISDVYEVKVEKETTWDPKIIFYHVGARLGKIEDYSKINATGESYNLDKSQLIAWMEFYERLSASLSYNTHLLSEKLDCFKLYPFKFSERISSITNTNGCAIHFNFKKAVQTALLELVERDAFLCHWYTKTPAVEINLKEKGISRAVDLMFSYCERNGWSLRAYLLRSISPFIYTIFLICKKKEKSSSFNLFVGFGSDTNFISALLKAYKEVARFFTKYNDLPSLEIVEKKLNPDKGKDFFWRLIRYQNTSHQGDFDFFYKSRKIRLSDIKQVKNGNIIKELFNSRPMLNIQLLPLPLALKDFIYAVKASDPTMQDVDAEAEPIFNKERLFHFSGSNQFYNVLHPIP